MGSFRDKLKELFAKITGQSTSQSRQRASVEDLYPNKHTEGRQSPSPAQRQPERLTPQTPPSQSVRAQNISASPETKATQGKLNVRDPYFFQIGFDFGTSSSKAVIRDINTDRAWVYTQSISYGRDAFLIPSVVLYRNGNFERHLDIETMYPEGGLYHLKMAAEKVATGIANAPILAAYQRLLGQNSLYKPALITKLACVYLLASAFSDIIASVIQKFPSYGQNADDQMAINMAIPVSNISDSRIRSFFERILNISWKLAWEPGSFPKKIPILDLAKKVELHELWFTEHGDDELCHVYPEVSANVQAFVRSPASSPDMRTIYFFSDTGAGTVDQSVFTYAGGAGRRLNYFSAGVFSRGSSQIEITACGSTIDEEKLEYWRKEKEQGKDSGILTRAKMQVGEALKADTGKTLRDTLACLPFGTGGISPANTLKENIKFIFSGGGHAEFPYQLAVTDAYKDSLRTIGEPLVTSMARPPDLEVPKEYSHWVNRLYVAYGLSFLFHDLAENTFPSDNKIDPAEVTSAKKCSCNGRNKNCLKCYGTGVVQ